MNIIILAAGFATRLYPLTEQYPKALLKVQGKPVIEYITDQLQTIPHIEQAVMVSNDRYYSSFSHWLGQQHFPFPVQLLNNGVLSPEDRKGAVGDLFHALQTLPPQDTLVLASDTLISEPIKTFISFSHISKAPATMLISLPKESIAGRLGCAVLNERNIITQFVEKPAIPPSTLAAIPYYFYPKKSLALITQYLQESHNQDAPGSLLTYLIRKTDVYGYLIKNGYYFDIGTKESLNNAEKYFETR